MEAMMVVMVLLMLAWGKALLAASHEGRAAYENGAWWEALGPAKGFSGFAVAERAICSSGHSLPGTPPGTAAGLLRSIDAGARFVRLGRGAVTALLFDIGGERVLYGREGGRCRRIAIDGEALDRLEDNDSSSHSGETR